MRAADEQKPGKGSSSSSAHYRRISGACTKSEATEGSGLTSTALLVLGAREVGFRCLRFPTACESTTATTPAIF